MAEGAILRFLGIPILAAPNLVSLLNHLKGTQQLPEPAVGIADEGIAGL